jgi:hypothetical protein
MTITIKDFLEIIQYKITGGDDYCWQCYGPNARSMDYWNGKHDGSVSITIVFDSQTQVVYQMEAWDGAKKREYRWIHPAYRNAIEAEAKRRHVDHVESIDGSKFIDLEVAEDITEKATAIFNGEEYDDRVIVPLTMDRDRLLQLMTLAHEADLTLNQFVEQILRKEIARLEEQPTWPPLDV